MHHSLLEISQAGLVTGLSSGLELRPFVRRRLSPEEGRAIEILGHAIEYLTDEYVHRGGAFTASDAEVEAIQLLMKLNRQIYFACPEVPNLGERWRTRLRTAMSH